MIVALRLLEWTVTDLSPVPTRHDPEQEVTRGGYENTCT